MTKKEIEFVAINPPTAMPDSYRIYVGDTIFWWNVSKESGEELVRYYTDLYPDKEISMIKNKEKL